MRAYDFQGMLIYKYCPNIDEDIWRGIISIILVIATSFIIGYLIGNNTKEK